MISDEQIENIKPPFFVVADCLRGKRKGLTRKKNPSKIVRIAGNDPLNVGRFPTAYFEGGGWVLLVDLMRFHTIVEANYNKK